MKDRSFVRWTHPSVKALAHGKDPIEVISQKARATTMAAMDDGWSGPPFDPIALAKHLDLDVRPAGDLRDARIVKSPSGKGTIEFNPDRPHARVRYSIAHEIGHFLFPDCLNQTRRRLALHEVESPEDWQVELLCNLAAAEFLMPVGSFPSLSEADLDINKLMQLRVEYEVSSEALLLRVTRLATQPCLVFTAVRVDSGNSAGRYRLEYVITNEGLDQPVGRGFLLPSDTVVAECTAIGYTAKGQEPWGREQLRVEAVGIPPYPGARHPRVVGLATLADLRPQRPRGMKELQGSALDPRGHGPRVIAHIVNDRTPHWGGGGFASRLGRRWPLAQDAFGEWAGANRLNLRLGNSHRCEVGPDLHVVTMVAQHGYGAARAHRLRYAALDQCLKTLADEAIRLRATVHMPRIGTGLAGGDWRIISELVANHLVSQGLDVTVYVLPSDPPRLASQTRQRPISTD